MKTEINIENWERREHFLFFKKFSEPFWGITTNVDCTKAYVKSKELGFSFYLYYLHNSLKSANEIEEFRLRIENEKLFCYDIIHAAPTVDRADGTFGFSILEYKTELACFIDSAKLEIDKVRKTKGLNIEIDNCENVIHYSTIPWIQFTSLSHARHFGFNDSIPKITFGKIFEENGNKKMPVSIHVNHALVDGLHVAKYLELFQNYLNE